MSETKKPVRLKIPATQIGEFTILLRWDEDDSQPADGRPQLVGAVADPIAMVEPRRTLWVDFEIVEAILQREDGTLEFGDDVRTATNDPEQATPVVHGFVKWDGCTQFWLGTQGAYEGAHIDTKADLDKLFAAIHKARHEAARIVKMEEF